MSNQKKFEFCFVDESKGRKLTLEYCEADDERLQFWQQHGEIFLFANRSGCLALAKVLIKLALGQYVPGYHLHLGEDFSSDGLCLGLLSEDNSDDYKQENDIKP